MGEKGTGGMLTRREKLYALLGGFTGVGAIWQDDGVAVAALASTVVAWSLLSLSRIQRLERELQDLRGRLGDPE